MTEPSLMLALLAHAAGEHERTRERWSQAAFSDVLSIESRRVSAEHERARAAPAAAASAPDAKPDFSKMSTREKFQWALDNPRRG